MVVHIAVCVTCQNVVCDTWHESCFFTICDNVRHVFRDIIEKTQYVKYSLVNSLGNRRSAIWLNGNCDYITVDTE